MLTVLTLLKQRKSLVLALFHSSALRKFSDTAENIVHDLLSLPSRQWNEHVKLYSAELFSPTPSLTGFQFKASTVRVMTCFYCAITLVPHKHHAQGEWNKEFMEGNVQPQLRWRSDLAQEDWAPQGHDKSGRDVAWRLFPGNIKSN